MWDLKTKNQTKPIKPSSYIQRTDWCLPEEVGGTMGEMSEGVQKVLKKS